MKQRPLKDGTGENFGTEEERMGIGQGVLDIEEKARGNETSMASVYAFCKRACQNEEKRKTGKGTREGQCS